MKMEQPFPIVGDKDATLRLTHPAAQLVIALGNGEYVDGGEDAGPSRADLEKAEAEIQAGTLKKIGDPDSEGQAPVFDTPDEPEVIKKPYGNAPKSAWARYACSIDKELTEERAELMTKADLMSKYGERL